MRLADPKTLVALAIVLVAGSALFLARAAKIAILVCSKM